MGFIFMIFLFIKFILSRQVFNVTSDSIRSIVLYFGPRDIIEVNVNSSLQTYFSDIMKANGLSIEVETNDSSLYGPYSYLSHLDGIDFGDDYSDYKITFINEGDYNIQLAVIFAEDLETTLDIIKENFSNYDFPITEYPSDEYKFFYNSGLLFHVKKYSSGYFIAIPIMLALIFLTIIIFGIPKVMESTSECIKKNCCCCCNK